jgi:TatD DNase family protein
MKKLTTPLVDSHAHLDAKPFTEDLETVIERARENGVEHILTVGCDLESSRSSVDLALRYPNIYASVGIHPHDANTVNDSVMDELSRMIESTTRTPEKFVPQAYPAGERSRQTADHSRS